MRRVAFLLAGLGLVGVVAGCELLLGIKEKTQAEPTDASTPDAATEDPSVPCSQQPAGYLFCDDFDSEIEAGESWEWDTTKGNASIEFDTTQYKTPPRSVQVKASTPDQAQLGQPVGLLMNGYRLAFDLFVDVPDLSPIPQVGVAQIYRSDGAGTLMVNYLLGPGSTCSVVVYDGPTDATVTLSVAPPPLRTWTRIVLVYDAVEGVTVIEDGQTLGTSVAAALGAPGDTTMILGGVFTNPPGSGTLVFELDDVVMRGQ
jgi:hypothetical protein